MTVGVTTAATSGVVRAATTEGVTTVVTREAGPAETIDETTAATTEGVTTVVVRMGDGKIAISRVRSSGAESPAVVPATWTTTIPRRFRREKTGSSVASSGPSVRRPKLPKPRPMASRFARSGRLASAISPAPPISSARPAEPSPEAGVAPRAASAAVSPVARTR